MIRKSIGIMIIIILLISSTKELCSEGCLRCSPTDVCEICDVNLNFVREESGCIIQNLNNCLISYEKNKCSKCVAGYYVNEANYLCSEVEIKIPNCHFYKTEKICEECEPGYFVKQNICNEVRKLVDDCAEYEDDGKCRRCFEKVLSINQDKCLEPLKEMDFNCAFRYFPQSCVKCKSGFELKRILDPLELENTNIEFANLRKKKFKSRINYKNFPFCFSSKAIYDSNPECKNSYFLKSDCFNCEPGFYFSDETNKCVENPKPFILTSLLIPHCSFINPNSISCEKCFEGYFIHFSKKKCFPHSNKVSGCAIMSQKNDGECYLCLEDYFLETSELCVKRQFVDPNCFIFSFFSDECIECKENFLTNSNRQTCLPQLQNCEFWLTGLTSISCTKCASNHYLSENICQQVPLANQIAGCLDYNQDIKCTSCEAGKILLHNISDDVFNCVFISSQTIFSKCGIAEYDSATGYKCKNCSSNGVELIIKNQCVTDTNVPVNCELYIVNNGVVTCTQCNTGYYLNTLDNSCVYADVNCRLFASNPGNLGTIKPQCIVCVEGKFLINNICIDESSNNGTFCHLQDGNQNCLLCHKTKHYLQTIVEKQYEECRSKLFYDSFSDCGVIERTSDYLTDHSEDCVRCPVNTLPQYDDSSVCHNCSDNKCALNNPGTSDLLVVERNPADRCIIRKENQCLQYRDVPQYYFTGETDFKTTFYFIGNQLKSDIEQYVAKGYKENYSKYFRNVFFTNNTTATSNTISAVTCITGISRSFEKNTLLPNDHDCQIFIKNCNSKSSLLIGSKKRIFASCNKCFNNMAVHFVQSQIATSLTTTLFPNLSTYLSWSYQGTYLPSTFCYPAEVGTQTVTDCVLFEVTVSGGTVTRTCVDCKAKYKLSGGTCQEISNCEKSKITGRCEKCFNDPVNNYYALNGNNACVASTQNCLKVNPSDTSVCIKCIDGFKYQTATRTCTKIQFYNCKKFEGENCIECRDPTEIVYRFKKKELLSNITCQDNPGSTKIQPPNCELVDYKGFCVKCNAEYFADLAGKCYSKNKVENCKLFNGLTGHCFECNNGYVYNDIQKKCLSPYNMPYNKTCAGNYANPFKINKGKEVHCGNLNISNCEFLDYSHLSMGKIGCQKCKIGFKIQEYGNNDNESCINLEPLPNCKTHKTDKFLNFSCIECIQNFYLDHSYICRPRFQIPECSEYFINSRYCEKCNEDYFVFNNECKKRSNVFSFCREYYTHLDDCKVFEPDYQYFYELREMILYPPPVESSDISNATKMDYTGISGCEEYYDYTTCRVCGSNTYLQNNECKLSHIIIPNCVHYKQNSVCSECSTGYLLIGNECKLIKAQNCLLFTDETKCKTCPEEYPILNSNFDCTKNAQLQFCLEYKSQSSCGKCDNGYYLKNNICVIVEKKIEKCLSYDANQNCVACQSGYYIWQNNCFPNPEYDPNCENFSNSKFECSLCYEGYILRDGFCFKCGDIFENCAICDDQNNEKCLLCKSGFYMDKTGKCNKNNTNQAYIPVFIIDF